MGPPSYFHRSTRHNGALEQRFLIYAFRMEIMSKEAEADPVLKTALIKMYTERTPELVRRFPIAEGATMHLLVSKPQIRPGSTVNLSRIYTLRPSFG